MPDRHPQISSGRAAYRLGVAAALLLTGMVPGIGQDTRISASVAAEIKDEHGEAQRDTLRLNSARLDDSIALASRHLLDAQLAGGLFDYDFDFLLARASGKANIVRQAGTTYALGEIFSHSRDPALREPLARAVAALAAKSIAVTQGAAEKGNLISFNGKRSGIKSGATALALLAELYYFRTSGDGRFAQQRDAWLNGLLALHRPGAGFLRAPDAQEESHYYNGEIWLALAFYSATFEVPGIEARLKEVDDYMMAAYGRAPHIGFFHWGVMAAERRFRDTGRAQFQRFAESQAQNFLDNLRPERKPDSNTCYSLEGLIPALDLTSPESPLFQPLKERIAWEMAKNLTLQIKPDQPHLDLGGGTRLQSPHLVNYQGAFLAGRKKPFTRIDYTQHCLSAALKYRKWLERDS